MESIQYVYISGHAISRGDAVKKIENTCDNIKSHLIKLLVCTHKPSVNHWLVEIEADVSKLERIRLKKNAKLSEQSIYNYLYDNESNRMDVQIRQQVNTLKKCGYDVHSYIDNTYDFHAEVEKIEKFYRLLSKALADFYANNLVQIDVREIAEKANIL